MENYYSSIRGLAVTERTISKSTIFSSKDHNQKIGNPELWTLHSARQFIWINI